LFEVLADRLFVRASTKLMLLFNLLVAIAALWLAFLYLRYRKWLTETHYYLPPSVNFIEGTVGEFVRAKSSGQVLDILLRGVRAGMALSSLLSSPLLSSQKIDLLLYFNLHFVILGSSVSQLIFPLGIHRAVRLPIPRFDLFTSKLDVNFLICVFCS